MGQRGALWAVAGPLIAFKIWFVILLLMYAPTRQGFEWVIITGWPWAVAVLVLIVGPIFAWSRLMRVRARRKKLREAEWMVEPSEVQVDRLLVQAGITPAGPHQWPLWETVSRLEDEG